MRIIYFILHTITGCSEDNLIETFNGKLLVCNKCGREHFAFRKY